ncbi:SDR family oxidoreductase [Arenicella xantha]|uniref:Nucleoside-diphosphate-sugar epimerase n=1 Tax=Arenicella xantha TaxID=644221 RepID=A0A395JN11_9GAMM|nr:NAD(P)-dependent oxidoreductase [Arenicella xantha]RBP53041.1 nucleoside-diphosphate-sugar epimerase [Arenicella xantha]
MEHCDIETDSPTRIVIYGGNGFVGTHIAKELADQDACTVCLSRTGYKPLHLKDESWSERIRWCKGDASDPDEQLLQRMDVLICLVGSPPVPTFSKQAYEQQVFMNGVTNATVIDKAQQAGVKRIVLLGAKLPALLQSDQFGYAKGKRLAREAAEQFAAVPGNQATVLQPGAIYGTRYLASGKALHLDWFMRPLATLMPWQFVSVDKVAQRVASVALNESPQQPAFQVIDNRDI